MLQSPLCFKGRTKHGKADKLKHVFTAARRAVGWTYTSTPHPPQGKGWGWMPQLQSMTGCVFWMGPLLPRWSSGTDPTCDTPRLSSVSGFACCHTVAKPLFIISVVQMVHKQGRYITSGSTCPLTPGSSILIEIP